MNHSLRIKTFSWDKHQYELFDHESNSYVQDSHDINRTGYLYRNNNENNTRHHEGFDQIMKNEFGEQSKIMVAFSQSNGNFKLTKLDFYLIGSAKQHKIHDQDDLWILVPRSQIRGQNLHQLKEKDIFRVGRKQYLVVQMNFENEVENFILQKPFSHYESYSSMLESQCGSILSSVNQSPTKDRRSCRICLGSSQNQTNPLVSICKCSGTMKYIHYDCIKTWLLLKQDIKLHPPFCSEIKAKSVRCELCLQFYPPSFFHQNTQFILYQIEGLSLKNYMILEDLEGQLLIINFNDETQLTLGRGHTSQIKVSEITVSREHAQFTLKDKKVYVQDLESKFGTLVKMQILKTLVAGDTLDLQCGRTKIQIKVQKNQKPLLSMCSHALLCSFQHDSDSRDSQFLQQ